jgi:CRISPR-associated protein Csh1
MITLRSIECQHDTEPTTSNSPRIPSKPGATVFQRLYEFSQCLPSKANWERLDEGMPDNYDRGIAVCFDQAGHWQSIEVRHGNKGVVYRSGPPNGSDLTPCTKLAKSTRKRLLKAVQDFVNSTDTLSSAKRQWLQQTIDSYQDHADAIWTEIEHHCSEAGVNKDHRAYVYWAGSSLEAPVYAWPEIHDYLTKRFLEPFSKGGQHTGSCSVCAETNKTVYGNFSVIACYNLDKKGNIAGGFHKHHAYRNLPVCEDCALALAEAFTFGEQYFSSYMAGQAYLALPYSSNPEIQQELATLLRRNPQRFSLGKTKDLVADEWDLFDEFRDQGDQIAIALIFFKVDKASWQIRAEVQQILPSRLDALHQAAKQIAAAEDLIQIKAEKEKPLVITATTFRHFTGYGEGSSEDTLRSWLIALFEKRPIDSRLFLHLLVTRILATSRKEPQMSHWITREAWGFYRYARLTGLIHSPAPTEEIAMQNAIPNSPYGRYIEDHQDFFNGPELVIAFLTGCYASVVASVQRDKRGAAPFTKKFVGRLLNQKALQRLYREGHDKLSQYDKLGYVITGLDPDLAAAWVASGDHWDIDDERATFAFTIGYSLAYRIKQLATTNHPPEDDA